jgi:hypothetical protein
MANVAQQSGKGRGYAKFREYLQGEVVRRIPLPRTRVNKGKKRRARVLGPGPSYLVGLRSPKTLVVPVQLPPYSSIGVGPVVDVNVIVGGVIP